MGAWIETGAIKPKSEAIIVAPRMGAWIETIEDLLIRPRRSYILAESRSGGFIDVTYYVRIRSGAILRHEVSYEYE